VVWKPWDEPYTNNSVSANGKETCNLADHSFLGEMLTATAMQVITARSRRRHSCDVFALDHLSGGNSGSQQQRWLSRDGSRRLRLRDWFGVVRKEYFGIALGLILGTIGFFRIHAGQYLHIFDYGQYHWLVAITVGVALVEWCCGEL